MASSAQKQLAPSLYNGATAAPPPTPSTQSNNISTSDSAATADILSKLLHRLPPSLSLPTRRSPHDTCPPIVSLFSLQNPSLANEILTSASQLGYFQLTDHLIAPQLALSAESDSLSLFKLTRDQKQLSFPKNWPLGFDGDDDGDGIGESFCLDSSCSSESTQLNLSFLGEFTREMGKVGWDVLESLCSAVGFENPSREDPNRACSFMWISEGCRSNKPVMLSRVYPYVIGLHYQIRSQKYSLLADSGWVSASPQVDSVLVTIGDIAQVWSNGKLKKVRGKPVTNLGEDNESRCITMSLLLTLPTDSTVSPVLPGVVVGGENDDEDDKEEKQSENNVNEGEEMLFKSFAFEDYAWRVYHQRVFFKDPLDRYRV